MFNVGKVQKAYVNRLSEYGAYMSDEINGTSEILLPNKFKPEDVAVNDEMMVFIYHDSEQRLTATNQKPILQVEEIGFLKCVGKIKSGFFLNNGIDKDVFLPYGESKGDLIEGRKYLVMLLLDENGHISSTMKIYNHLLDHAQYAVNQQVKGMVYEIKSEMGAFVAIENKYHGFIPKHELYNEIKVGATIEARITKIREDGKMNLSIKQKSSVQIFDDAEIVMQALTEHNGILLLNDASDPERIKAELNLSKRAFKRAVGKLLKEKKIEITDRGIQIIQK
ncbi:CvfB family protein [Fusibacter ferrireducens]|nr:S1-like domain-containing RNA-binding protein [Fusibacter ferrireducens]